MTGTSDGRTRWLPARVSRWMKIAGAIILVVLFFFETYPFHARSMGFSYNLASYVPGAIRVEANGYVIDRVSTGRNSMGGAYYKTRFSDKMDFRIFWYDAAEKTAWMSDVVIWGRELSAYDEKREVLSLDLVVGPGADVLATTDNQDALRLLREKRTNEITREMNAPVILRQLCATQMPLNDPRIAPLVSTSHDPGDTVSYSVDRIMASRDAFIAAGGVIQSRCNKRG